MVYIGGGRLVNFVCGITFSLSLIFSVGNVVEIAIIAPELAVTSYLEPPPQDDWSDAYFTKFASLTCLIFNVVELICFVIIFLEMYRHHKSQVHLCLSNKPNIAKRKRQSTITAAGHFASWVIEMMVFGVVAYVVQSVNRDEIPMSCWIFIRVLIPSVNYVLFPAVQAISSHDLRAHVFNIECCKKICPFVKCGPRNGNNDVENAVAEEIELVKVTGRPASTEEASI